MEGIEKKNRKLKKVSIILFIIIIFLGVFDILWYNNISNVDYKSVSNIEKFAISEIAGFNSQFTRYCGTQKGTVIKGLLSFVIESNNTNNHNVTIGIKDGSIWYNKDILNLMDKINLKSIYSVTIYDSNNDEYMDKIFIREEGEEVTEEEAELEQIRQEKYKQIRREERKEKIIVLVKILLVALIIVIVIIKIVKILKGNNQNKKYKLLLTIVTIESIIIGGHLLLLFFIYPLNVGHLAKPI